MYRESTACNPVLVIAEDFVFSSVGNIRTSTASFSYLAQLVCQRTSRSGLTQPLEPLLKSSPDRLGTPVIAWKMW